MKALICVDVQNDFLPGGALGVPDGDQVIRPLIDLMDDADIIVLTRDWHPEDHVSFSAEPEYVDGSWPKHCVMGTDGAAFHLPLLQAALLSFKPVLLVHKGFDADKEAYSGFEGIVVDVLNEPKGFDRNTVLWNDANTAIGLQEALRIMGVGQVYVGGLALDYCVQATARDSGRAGFPTWVYLNATRPVGFVSGIEAVLNMAKCGVNLIG